MAVDIENPGEDEVELKTALLDIIDPDDILEALSAGVSLGVELVSNTDFAANANGWTLHDGSTWSAGRITTIAPESAGDLSITTTVSVEAGKVYLLFIDSVITDDVHEIRLGGAVVGQQSAEPTLRASFGIISTNASATLKLDFYNYVEGAERVVTFVSLREITVTRAGLSLLNLKTGNSLIKIYDGLQNIAIGESALQFGGGSYSVAIGHQAIATNTTGYYNIAMGFQALGGNTEGHDNVVIGASAASAITIGNSNVCIGSNNGASIIEGSSNILIGSYTNTPSDTTSYLSLGGVIKGDMVAGPIEITLPYKLATYDVAGLPSAATMGAGSIVYCSNGNVGAKCLAVSDGTNWKVVALGITVAAI